MTKIPRRLFLATAVLAHAACGAETLPVPEASPAATAAPTAAAATDAPPNPPINIVIPARFHGVWDAAGGTCDPSSESRLEVAADRLEYYESLGSVTRVEAHGGDDALVTLAMEGEGMAWTDAVRLQLTTTQGREALLLLPGPDSDVVVRPAANFRCPA